MKLILKCVVLGALVGLGLCGSKARANFEVSASVQIGAAVDFYEPLAPSGVWVEVGSYGRCWRPARVAAGWRPYCDGTWVWTDAGWYWQSDEPWAWACYHYGTWVYDPGYGWVWIPGIEWAPAWVCWRTGGGHIGWAPCGPRGVVVAPSVFVFVEERHFHRHHRPNTVVINNTTIINRTTEINVNVRHETRTIEGRRQTVVVNDGPKIDEIRKATGRKFTAVAVQKEDRRTSVPDAAMRKPGKPREMPTEPVVRDGKDRIQQPPPKLRSTPVEKRTPKIVPEERNVPPVQTPLAPVIPERKRELPTPRHEIIPEPRTPEPREVLPSAPLVRPGPKDHPEPAGREPGGREEGGDRGKGHDKDRDKERDHGKP